MDQGWLPQLRKLLSELFDEDELRDLCFELGVEYDNLRGGGKANKARELVLYLNRRGHLSKLVARCSELRPDAPWPSTPVEDPSALPTGEYSAPIDQGLSALSELMRRREVRAVVETFRIRFRDALEQMDIVSACKDLHDLLHRLQFQCCELIILEARRFQDDEIAQDNLRSYRLTLQEIIDDLEDAARRASPAMPEPFWIQTLVEAHEALGTAIEQLSLELLETAIRLLNRVLAIHPSQINTRLNTVVRMLRLPSLLDALAAVSDILPDLHLEPERVNQFEAGVDALGYLNDRLNELVGTHDRWQTVDDELRLLGASMGRETWDVADLGRDWAHLKVVTLPLHSDCTDKWAKDFRKAGEDLDGAITARNPTQIGRCFRYYRRQVAGRFHKVDVDLKRLCADLPRVRESLARVTRILE